MRAAERATARPLADAAPRRARARARAVADGRQLRVHHGRARAGAFRRRLSRDARTRGLRPGRLRRPARLHGRRGVEARAAARRAPPRLRRVSGAAPTPVRARERDHARARAPAVLSPTVLGLPRDAIARMRWRSDFSSLSQSAIARKLAADGEPRLQGVAVPAGTETALDCGAAARRRRARVGRRRRRPRADLPAEARPRSRRPAPVSRRRCAGRGRVLGIQLALPRARRSCSPTTRPRASVALTPSGEVDVGPLRADGRVLTDWRDWTLSRGGDVVDAAGRRADPLRLPGHRPAPGLPAAAANRRAADAGRRLAGHRERPPAASGARPCSTSRTRRSTRGSSASRSGCRPCRRSSARSCSPTRGGSRPRSTQAHPARAHRGRSGSPGTPARALAAAPLLRSRRRLAGREWSGGWPATRSRTRRRSHSARRHSSRSILAVLGFWVGVVSELHDERSDFFDLEAQGLAPADMRRQLRMRGVILLVARARRRACARRSCSRGSSSRWSASRGRPACRSRRSGSIPTGSPAGSVWRR